MIEIINPKPKIEQKKKKLKIAIFFIAILIFGVAQLMQIGDKNE